MQYHYNSRPYGWSRKLYLTRKDFHHKHLDWGYSWVNKKRYRKVSNGIVRRYKGDTQDGNWYRKLYDLKWTVI